MKEKIKKVTPLYKQRTPAMDMAPKIAGVAVLKEAVAMPGIGLTLPVRAAKAKLSALLDVVAGGQEIVITSDGRPKAKLVKIDSRKRSKVFQGMGDYLMKQPIHRRLSAEEAVNLDRDGRGW